MNGRTKRWLTRGLWALALAWGGSTFAGPEISQMVGCQVPIQDEFGQLLSGSDPSAYQFNLPVVEGDLVELFLATDGVVYPPAVDGTPDPRNPAIGSTRVGRGVSPAQPNSGKFGSAIAPRPGGNSRIFARVYNAPTVEDSSFYGDSQIFTVRSWKNEPFMVTISKTDIPLDPNDDDNDGLNNSWEKSYGTDPNNRDSDGDGFSDGAETQLLRADPLDDSANLQIVQVQPANDGDALLEWDSVEGVTYRVEFTADDLDLDPQFTVVAAVLGEADHTSLLVPDGLADGHGCYRVRVVAGP